MLTNKSILKLCKRATKKNPKSVKIFDMGSTKARYLETNRGVYLAEKLGEEWLLTQVPYVGY